MIKKLQGVFRGGKNILSVKQDDAGAIPAEDKQDKAVFTADLDRNKKIFAQRLEKCSDIVSRDISIAGRRALLLYNDLLVDKSILNENILEICFEDFQKDGAGLIERLKNKGIAIGSIITVSGIESCIEMLFYGSTVIILDGSGEALVMDTIRWEKRAVENPATEPSIRGPKDSFTEVLYVNASLLRRRLVTPDFKMVDLTIGVKSRTKVKVCYLESTVSPKLVEEVLRRLNLIDIDALLAESYIEELIEDEPYSIFPTIQVTERPDVAVASILEGRVVILQDNTPFSLIMPAVAMQFFQSADDYYNRWVFGTFIRIARVAALFFTVYLPSLYVAVTTYHQEMLPTAFMISLQAQREGVPYPAVFEATLMGFAFEILREAGLRLPRAVGQAVSIVGALIIGESAVRAGLVSPAMVIVTAVTAIAAFTIPSPGMYEPITIIRLILVIMGGIMGIWGLLIFTLVILGHLASLRSFGTPYLIPAGPFIREDLDDYLIRAPLWQMKKRPRLLAKKNLIRQGKRPSPLPDTGRSGR